MNFLKNHQSLIANERENYVNLLPLHYKFKFRNIDFDCDVKKSTDEEKIILLLTADLGILPYSSENIVRRTELLGGLGTLIARGLVNINNHCSISMSFKTIIDTDFNAKSLIEATVYTLLDARDVINQVSGYIEKPARRY